MKKEYTPPIGIGFWKDSRSGGWRVRVGIKYLGKARKPYFKIFKTKEEAVSFCKDLDRQASGDITTAKRLGITELELAEVKVALERLNGKASLIMAADSWLKHEAPFLNSPTISQAIIALVAAKQDENLTDAHINEMKNRITKIFKGYENVRMDEITSEQMTNLLRANDGRGNKPSASLRGKRICYANILYNYGISQRWVSQEKSPLFKIKKPKADRKEGVRILTPRQVAKLLWTAKESNRALIPALSLKIFSGVRNSELFKLRWSEVDEKQITVPAAYSKTGRRRVITIHSTLASWLALEPKTDKTELIFPCVPARKDRVGAWYSVFNPVRTKAGFNSWPQNALRHIFGSYHYALHNNENLTAAEMGNSPAVVKQHYLNAVKLEPCKKFWRLTPAIAEATAETPEDQPELPDETWTQVISWEEEEWNEARAEKGASATVSNPSKQPPKISIVPLALGNKLPPFHLRE